MAKKDNYVSPYLRRRIRSPEEILRDQAERARKANRPKDGPAEPPAGDLPERDNDDDEPRKQ